MAVDEQSMNSELAYWHSSMEAASAVNIQYYPDQLPLITVRGPAERALLRPKRLDTFFAAMFWFDQMAERGLPMPELILPYFPGARQDRLNPTGDALFTAKSVAMEINRRGFPSVTVIDPHSDVVPALVDRCRVVQLVDAIGPLDRYTAVIAPDGGAEKRAAKVAQKLGLPLMHAWKTRNVTDGSLSGFGVEPLDPEGLYLIVDDICDGGGTFLGLSEIMNARAHLAVTHGVFSKGASTLLMNFEHIFTTDSIVSDIVGANPRLHRSRPSMQLLETGTC